MRRTALRVLPALSITALLLGVIVQPSFAQNLLTTNAYQQTPATPSQPEWLSLTVVSVKPGMMVEFQNFMKNQTNPALRKGGVPWRHVWQSTPAAGNAFEFVIVTPIAKLAEFDGPSPLEKALGAQGFAAWLVKAGSLVTSVNRYVIRTRPDLSNPGKMTGPPKLAVVSSYRVALGRAEEFESYLKNDLMPVMRQGEAAFWVSQTVFGGDAAEYVTLTLRENFADIDKGPVPLQVLGRDGANKLFQKLPAGVVTHVQRNFTRFVPELSLMPAAN